MSASSVSDEAMRRFVRVHSGTAAPAELAEIATWRSVEPAHERAFREAEAIWEAAAGLRRDPVSGLVCAPSARARVSPRALTRRRSLALAASLAGTAALGLVLMRGPQTLLADFAAPTGERQVVPLADGSVVTLDAGAAIDVNLTSAARRIDLRKGRAFFHVTRDPAGRSFIVDAAGTTVAVRGTAFEVERRTDGTVAVTVSEHSVTVVSPHGRAVILEEGQRVLVDEAGQPGTVASLPPGRVAEWREGRLVAEAQPLSEVIAALSDYHRGWILVTDPSVAKLSVSAVLDLQDPLASLAALERAVPIRVRTLSPYLVIISATSGQ